jgi:NAD(P)-dependent dehydrogenase (short-subunit alcohol dehydrogenase family)
MSHLKEQVAVVTGGSSGIGFAIAASLAAEGMDLAIAARDQSRLQKAATQLEGAQRRVIAVQTDVSVGAQVEELVRRTLDAFGRIDLLVNNAGIGLWASISECEEDEWDRVQAVNLKGAFLCTRAVLPVMKRQGSGYIVNIASVAGKTGFGGASAYCASKFGMVGFTESLLEEGVGHHIKATAICPGYVATPMVEGASVPLKEMIPPEDIGQLVVGLLHLSPMTVIKEIVVERIGAIGT